MVRYVSQMVCSWRASRRFSCAGLQLFWLMVLLVVAGCGQEPSPAVPPSASPSSSPSSAPLPSRAEVVRQADELAVMGERKGGGDGARLTYQAAQLRERIWRLEGKRTDALEALELYRAASQKPWPKACDAQLEVALLTAELNADPSGGYREVYRARASQSAPDCRARADAALTHLAAFKPQPDVLRQLEQEGARLLDAAGGPPPALAPSSGPAAPAASNVVLPPVSSQPKGPVRITSIEHYSADDSGRVVVFITRPALFETGYLAATGSKGPRLYVDIRGASYRGKRALAVGGLVRQVRVGKQKARTRIVLDLERDAFRRVFYLPEPFRLVIDVSKDAPKQRTEQRGPRGVRRIVIDPGHGGHDPGAVGAMGLQEKDVVLDVAHRAAPLIARELGISTLLTRDSDVFIPLAERTARANAFGADLFISVHCNASEVDTSHGVMSFVLAASTDDLGLRIAARENAASPAAAAELATSLSRMLDQGTMNQSRHFAQLLQRASVAALLPGYPGVKDRGVKSAGFYVLAGAHMPAVLYETSFISNPTEEARLNSGDYRQKLADSIVNAVRAYKDGL